MSDTELRSMASKAITSQPATFGEVARIAHHLGEAWLASNPEESQGPKFEADAVLPIRTLVLLPAGVYDVRVALVHDGDTCHVLIPVAVKLRLDGIQAPELSTPKGPAARDYFFSMVDGKKCVLTLGGDYKYGGERMGKLSVDGSDVSDKMIETGHAVAWNGKGPRPASSLATTEPEENEDRRGYCQHGCIAEQCLECRYRQQR